MQGGSAGFAGTPGKVQRRGRARSRFPAQRSGFPEGSAGEAEEMASFMGSAPEVRVLGDCNGQNGRIISATRNAFIVASRV